MKKIYLVLLLIFISSLFNNSIFAQCEDVTVESLTNPGPFDVDTLTEADGIRNGPNYLESTIYYPTNATPPYMSIAIVPGYTAYPSSVEEWGPFYASHGIVTIIIGTNSIFEFPEDRAIALLDALETIRYENTRVTSPLEGALNLDQLAVSGWSMGGGGAQRAAVLDNTVAGVVALCPWLPNPMLNHQSPLLIFSGENDNVAPPAQHANIHYDVTPIETDKVLFEIANGNHSVANTPNGGNGAAGKIALSWLKLYVEGNDCYCPLLTEDLLVNPPDASNLEQDFECELLGLNTQEIAIVLYPNPVRTALTIKGNYTELQVSIYDLLGREISSQKAINQIDVSWLEKGTYVVKLTNGTDTTTRKLIKI